MTRLTRTFFARRSTIVGPALLGRVLVRSLPGGEVLRARIVETEAYDEHDPASHSFRGPTPRNAMMFGPAGHLYVYFTYGMHHCMNVVTGADGVGSAVLLRAAEPLEGIAEMERARGTDRIRDLCRGPARLAQAVAVDRSFDGIDLVDGDQMWFERGTPVDRARIRTGPRIGIRVGVDRPWRSFVDEPWVSASRSTPAASRP